jgi:hypothetical protein
MENSKGWLGSYRQRDGTNARNAQSLDGVDSEVLSGLSGSFSRASLLVWGGGFLMHIFEMKLACGAIEQCCSNQATCMMGSMRCEDEG